MPFKPARTISHRIVTRTVTRAYLHGDLVEPGDRRANAGDYYCARCESFVSRDHFYRRTSPHASDPENLAYYQQMSKDWYATHREPRPTSALNLFC